MKSRVLSNIPEAQCGKENTKKLLLERKDGHVIFHLDSYSQTELKELKNKFISDLQSIRTFIHRIESDESAGQTRKRKRTSLDKETLSVGMMRKCGVILAKLMKHKHGWVFNQPVDVVALGLGDYYQVIKRPMDLGTVKLKLGKGGYGTPLDFADDVRLTFRNALLYNRKGDDVHTMATVLLDMFDKLFDLVYEEYEVERKLHQKSQVVSSHRDLVKPKQTHSQAVLPNEKSVSKTKRTVPEAKGNLRMHSQAALSREVCKEAAKKSVSKTTVPKAKENLQMHSQAALPKEVCKEAAKKSVSKTTVPEAKENLQMHSQAALPKEVCKEAAKKSVSKTKRIVPEAKENLQSGKEMSNCERDKLGLVLQDLAGEYLNEILQIVAKRNSKMTTPGEDGEIELDVHALDSETMWDLHRFARLQLKADQNSTRKEELTSQSTLTLENNKFTREPAMSTTPKVEEDIDIGKEMPVNDYPPIVIERDDTPCPSSSSSSGTDSSSDSDNSSGSDSEISDAA